MSGIQTIEAAQAYAEISGYRLSDKAERVVKALAKTGGKCPCVAVNAPECPCPSHKGDIEEDGKCHCNLFQKGE
jgi:ferredoxin-thioredoxin reductase catalytic subunit